MSRGRSALHLGVVLLGAGMVMIGGPTSVTGQLISPGKLAEPHAELEGIRECTNCHVLRKRGVDADKCLVCHTPVRTRIEADRGFHGGLVEEDCASCHKDHFGRNFALTRFDTLSFDHDRSGFTLEGSHTALDCASCHTAELIRAPDVLEYEAQHGESAATFLGLGSTCRDCHTSDDPHGTQFAERTCTDCHGQDTWDADGFDHAATRYPLDGLHRTVGCEGCHAPLNRPVVAGGLRFADVRFGSCASCHDDVHEGERGASCSGCHSTLGWQRINRSRFEVDFDHASTEYLLQGAHVALSCASCHATSAAASRTEGPAGVLVAFKVGTEGRAYPSPQADACTSCHVDTHDGVLMDGATGGVCTGCHAEDAWLPVDYGPERHDAETEFALTGAHGVTPCTGCHTSSEHESSFRFVVEATECRSCHVTDDAHRDQFADRGCAACHSTASFRIPDFDHGATGYPLDATHAQVGCTLCHVSEQDDAGTFVRYRPLETECRDCHGGAS